MRDADGKDYGVYVLLICILAPEYICPEKAWECFRKGKSTKTTISWITPDLVDEMKAACRIMPQSEACRMYGMHLTQFNRYVTGKRASKRSKRKEVE